MARHAWMVPLDLQNPYTEWLVHEFLASWKRGIGWLTLRRALIEGEAGFWGDRSRAPSSVVYLREGDHQVEAFGLLSPRPAVRWLASLGRPVALLAPEGWSKSVQLRVGAFEQSEVASWSPGFYRRPPWRSAVATRRLTSADLSAFAEAAPEWALRCWPDFESMISRGCAIGVPFGEGFASLAWVLDQTESFDAIGVYTAPRYRELGLARAAAGVLIEHIIRERRKIPLWAASTGNAASQTLARTLGLTPRVFETVFRWPPRSEASQAVEAPAAAGSSWMPGDDR